MTDQPADPPCHDPDCASPWHCRVEGVHHVVPSMARWCEGAKGRERG